MPYKMYNVIKESHLKMKAMWISVRHITSDIAQPGAAGNYNCMFTHQSEKKDKLPSIMIITCCCQKACYNSLIW